VFKSSEIIDYENVQKNIDLIAMASHGRTGAARFFLRECGAGVLNRIDRPLLMIRSKPNE